MKYIFTLLFLTIMFFSCASFPDEAAKRAKIEIETMYYADLPKYFPDEWNLMRDVWQKIDEAEKQRDRESVLKWYSYIMEKSVILDKMIEDKKAEEEKARLQKAEENKKLYKIDEEKQKEKKETIESVSIEVKTPEVKKVKRKKGVEDVRYKIEKRYPSFYTVKEGETLEEIADLPYIYNDRYQWPIIYKFNRNQVRDPNKLYKGQILKIPRNVSLNEIIKAREEAKAKNPKVLPPNAFTSERYKRYIEELLAED